MQILHLTNTTTLLGGEQVWTPNFCLKSFDMDSVQVWKAVIGKEVFTSLGIKPRIRQVPLLTWSKWVGETDYSQDLLQSGEVRQLLHSVLKVK